jgi:acetyltransferase-like isoleucine patch superfamily enzyme
MIHPTAVVEAGAVIGEWTKVWHFAHVRAGARVGGDCVIGKDVYIDEGVTIGDRCKIENGVSVYRGVTVEDDVIVGPNVTFTNDKYPRAFSKEWTVTPTVIRRGVGIGAGAVIVCGVEIGEYALIGAGAIVSEDVLPYSMVHGENALFVSWVCKCGRKVAAVEEKCGYCEY